MMTVMTFDNLLGGPPPDLPPRRPGRRRARGRHRRCERQPRHNPASSLAWAVLAERSLAAGDDLTGYAFARVGYHRGLDALRRNGWKGHGPIPWEHEPNQGSCAAWPRSRRRPS